MYRRPILWRERAALSRLPVLTRAAIHLPCGSAGLALEEASTFADPSAEGFSATVSFAILPVQANGTWMVVVASGVPGALRLGRSFATVPEEEPEQSLKEPCAPERSASARRRR